MQLNRASSLLFALLLAACGHGNSPPPAASAPATAASQSGTAPATGPRIVSTVPAATLNLVLMGAADHLVGVSKYDRLYLPQPQQNLPVVGDYQTMNYEQLVKLHPSVLIIQTLDARIDPKLREVAAAQHMELLNMHFENVNDIWSSALALGKAAGMEPQAQLAISAAQADLREIAAQYKDHPHPRVLYLVSASDLMVCGGNNFIDEMITAAGGDNIGAKIGNNFIETSRETIIKLAPEVLLIGAMDEPGEMTNDPRVAQWRNLPIPAAAGKRIYLVTDGDSLMASINIGKNVRSLAQMIHAGDAAAAGGKGGGP